MTPQEFLDSLQKVRVILEKDTLSDLYQRTLREEIRFLFKTKTRLTIDPLDEDGILGQLTEVNLGFLKINPSVLSALNTNEDDRFSSFYAQNIPGLKDELLNKFLPILATSLGEISTVEKELTRLTVKAYKLYQELKVSDPVAVDSYSLKKEDARKIETLIQDINKINRILLAKLDLVAEIDLTTLRGVNSLIDTLSFVTNIKHFPVLEEACDYYTKELWPVEFRVLSSAYRRNEINSITVVVDFLTRFDSIGEDIPLAQWASRIARGYLWHSARLAGETNPFDTIWVEAKPSETVFSSADTTPENFKELKNAIRLLSLKHPAFQDSFLKAIFSLTKGMSGLPEAGRDLILWMSVWEEQRQASLRSDRRAPASGSFVLAESAVTGVSSRSQFTKTEPTDYHL